MCIGGKRRQNLFVSILSRPASREQRLLRSPTCLPPACFNPLPAREPGATLKRSLSPSFEMKFQSSPGPRAGSNAR